MPSIYMRESAELSTNGRDLQRFEAGKTYEMNDFAAEVAISSGLGIPANEAKPDDPEEVEPPKPKSKPIKPPTKAIYE